MRGKNLVINTNNNEFFSGDTSRPPTEKESKAWRRKRLIERREDQKHLHDWLHEVWG